MIAASLLLEVLPLLEALTKLFPVVETLLEAAAATAAAAAAAGIKMIN